MNSRTTINREVNITALYFRNKKSLKSFPKRMEYNGQEYEFIESGLQYQILNKNNEVRLFDMTDGNLDYRLKFDYNKFTWTLISISNGLKFINY